MTHIDETMEQFDMFSTRKPRDVKAGASSGLKSVTKGIVTGAVGLVAAPIQGAKSGGLQVRRTNRAHDAGLGLRLGLGLGCRARAGAGDTAGGTAGGTAGACAS